MTKLPFHYIDIRTFVYATEDERRVERAIRFLIPEEIEIDRSITEGHHGDRILVLSARIDRADDIQAVFDQLADMPDYPRLQRSFPDRVTDDCELYFSLDKQQAFQNRLALGAGISIRMKIEAYPAKPAIAIENLKALE